MMKRMALRRKKMIKEKIYATTSFEIGIDGEDDTQEKSEIVSRVDASNIVITFLIGALETARTSKEDVFYFTLATDRVNKYGTMNFYRGPHDIKIIDESIDELKKMLAANTTALNHIHSGQQVKDMITYMVQDVDAGRRQTSGLASNCFGIDVSKLVIDDPPVCVNCGDVVVYDEMVDHVASSACYSQVTRNAEDSAGWELLEFEHEAMLNKTTNVPHKMVAASYDMWVPKWVKPAIQAYQSRKGFAGLELEEYLDKMAGTQSK
jgi:hypothetical protein